MYGGLGQSTGALLGGAMSDRMGIAKTFIRCGAMEGIVLLTFLGYRLFLHLKEQREQKLQKLNTSIAKS